MHCGWCWASCYPMRRELILKCILLYFLCFLSKWSKTNSQLNVLGVLYTRKIKKMMPVVLVIVGVTAMLNRNSVSFNIPHGHRHQCKPFLCIFTTFRPGNHKLTVITFVTNTSLYCIIWNPHVVGVCVVLLIFYGLLAKCVEKKMHLQVFSLCLFLRPQYWHFESGLYSV